MEKVTAIEPVNGHNPGDVFEVTEREAEQLVAKGLVKMAAPPQNKMARASENKSNPSEAAGEEPTSSASRAAPASAAKTAEPSKTGGVVTKAATKKAAKVVSSPVKKTAK